MSAVEQYHEHGRLHERFFCLDCGIDVTIRFPRRAEPPPAA